MTTIQLLPQPGDTLVMRDPSTGTLRSYRVTHHSVPRQYRMYPLDGLAGPILVSEVYVLANAHHVFADPPPAPPSVPATHKHWSAEK